MYIVKKSAHGHAIKDSTGDKVYYGICYLITGLLTILVLYPLIYVLSASFSSAESIQSGRMLLWPVEVSLVGYNYVFQYEAIWIGYRNTIFYTLIGTAINVAMTISCAYALARKGLRGRGFFTFLFAFTMLFSGGMIPGYILVRELGMLNTVWAMLIPGAISVYNLVVAQTFIESSIPQELLESAHIDGCSDIRYFFSIVLPLSKAILAVLMSIPHQIEHRHRAN